MAEALQRHTMVKASATGWAAAMSAKSRARQQPIIEGWARAGRPLMVRRPACNDPAGMIPLGLPLPPSHGKRRIAVALAPGEIIDACSAAIAGGCGSSRRLRRGAKPSTCSSAFCPETRTFGSLAWQHLTGLPYLSDGSDLDLLWPLSSARTREHPAVRHRADRSRQAPMRLDGEIVYHAGGVQWRELTGADEDEVLVKGAAGVHVTTRAAFLSGGAS